MTIEVQLLLARREARQALLQEFRRLGATVPQRAARVAEGSAAFEYYLEADVIREAAPELYYLDEWALRSLEVRERENNRRQLTSVAFVIGASLIVLLVLLSLVDLVAY